MPDLYHQIIIIIDRDEWRIRRERDDTSCFSVLDFLSPGKVHAIEMVRRNGEAIDIFRTIFIAKDLCKHYSLTLACNAQ